MGDTNRQSEATLMIRTGTRIRITTHEHAELAGTEADDFVDGVIVSQIKGRNGHSYPLWLVDLERGVTVNSEHRRRIGECVRYLVLKENWERFPLEWILKGYWIAVTPYAVTHKRPLDSFLDKPVNVHRRDFVQLTAQMCYQIRPESMDPYSGRWIKCSVLRVKEVEAGFLGKKLIERLFEVRIMLPNGVEYDGLSSDPYFGEGLTGQLVPIALCLTDCRAELKTSDAVSPLQRRTKTNNDYEHEATGTVAGLWWPQEDSRSIQIQDQLIVVEGTSKTSASDLALDDTVHVVGTLRFYRKTPSQSASSQVSSDLHHSLCSSDS